MVDNQVKFESILPSSRCLSTFSLGNTSGLYSMIFTNDDRRRINEQTNLLKLSTCSDSSQWNQCPFHPENGEETRLGKLSDCMLGQCQVIAKWEGALMEKIMMVIIPLSVSPITGDLFVIADELGDGCREITEYAAHGDNPANLWTFGTRKTKFCNVASNLSS